MAEVHGTIRYDATTKKTTFHERTFAPDSVSFPVLAALETMGVTDPDQRGAAHEWAGMIADRMWERELPGDPRRQQIRDRLLAVFPDEEYRRRLSMELHANLERAVNYAKSVAKT